MPHRLLVVEDDPEFHHLYRRSLGQRFRISVASTIREARKELKTQRPDAVIVDWELPDGNGLSLIRDIRASEDLRHLLIFMVTGRTEPDDQVAALNVGADDFMPKPITEELLLARVNALSRRADRSWKPLKRLKCGNLSYDPALARIEVAGQVISLSPKALRLLEFFLHNPNIVHSPRVIWEQVWGDCSGNWEHTLVVTLSNLRHDLSGWIHRVESRKGLGYSLDAEVVSGAD